MKTNKTKAKAKKKTMSKSRLKSETKTRAKAEVIQLPGTLRASLEDALEEFIWQNPIALKALYDCCKEWPCTVPLEPTVRKALVEKGFLKKEASIISVEAYKVVFAAMTGKEPSWPK